MNGRQARKSFRRWSFWNSWVAGTPRKATGSIRCSWQMRRRNTEIRWCLTMTINRALFILLLTLFLGCAWGGDQRPSIPWDSLTVYQQKIMAKLTDHWDRLPAERQHRLLKGLERWQQMDPEEKAWVKRRFKQWKALPAEQRKAIRQRFEKYMTLSADERAWVKERYKRFKQLSPERRKALRRQWQGMSKAQRQQALGKLKGLEQISPGERDRLLEKLVQ